MNDNDAYEEARLDRIRLTNKLIACEQRCGALTRERNERNKQIEELDKLLGAGGICDLPFHIGQVKAALRHIADLDSRLSALRAVVDQIEQAMEEEAINGIRYGIPIQAWREALARAREEGK